MDMPPVQGSFDEVERETLLLTRHLAPTRKPVDGGARLERSWYTLLSRIAAGGPMSIGELSEALGLDASTLNRQTAALTKEGYLERVPDPEGGMARKFRMTQAGTEHLEADRQANVDGIGRVMVDWDPADIRDFVRLMREFNLSIESLAGRPWPRA